MFGASFEPLVEGEMSENIQMKPDLSQGVAPPVASLSDRGETIELLVLDDSRFDAQQLARDCRKTDLPVHITVVDAFESYQEAIAEKRFDLVFVDYLLPEGDGIQACSLLRSSSANSDVPMVMITNEARHDVAVAAMKSGCLDYLSKDGLAPENLRSLILHAVGAFGNAARDAIKVELDLHRDEILNALRAIVREEMTASTPFSASMEQTLQEMMIAQGLLAPATGDTNWADILMEEETGFEFRSRKN